MKRTRWSYLIFVLGSTLIAMLLLLNAGFSTSQTAQAADVSFQEQPTATPPRTIFLNGNCSDDQNTSEHIRFGSQNSHYFQFLGKSGDWYSVTTEIFSTSETGISIDTKLLIYRRNPVENSGEQPITENDDKPLDTSATGVNRYESELTFAATEDRFYWIEVQNLISDGGGSYCLKISPINPPVGEGEPDLCEFNNTIETACAIEIVPQKIPDNDTPQPPETPQPVKPNPAQPPGATAGTFTYNFVPPVGQTTDLDYYKLWVKAGQTYICQTFNLSVGTDTNIIYFNHQGGAFDPPMGNDDIAPGNKASKLAITTPYTGWLYILVNTYDELVDYEYAGRYTYQFVCVNELEPDPPDGSTDDTVIDECEVNDSFDLASACQIILTTTFKENQYFEGIRGDDPKKPGDQARPLNFAQWSSGTRDVDHFRLWSKEGWRYTCLTQNLTNGNDTLMTMYYADNGAMTPGNNPNDDYQPHVDSASSVTVDYSNTRTGWLIVKVEPAMSYIPTDGGLYQYQLVCRAYPPPGVETFDNLNAPGTIWDATRAPGEGELAPPPGGTVVAEASDMALTATPSVPLSSSPAAVSFVALPAPTQTPIPPQSRQIASFTVQIYYDANDNHIKDEGEGVAAVPIYIDTGLSEMPYQAVTTTGGAAYVETETAVGRVQLRIPYLNINEALTVAEAKDIRLRIAP